MSAISRDWRAAWPLWGFFQLDSNRFAAPARHVHLLPELPAFTTGTRPERWIVVPALYLALAWIAITASGLAAHLTRGALK